MLALAPYALAYCGGAFALWTIGASLRHYLPLALQIARRAMLEL